jgi:hypothetical protein
MANFDPDPKAIGRGRRSTEARLARLLQMSGFDLPLDLIRSMIFDYHHTSFKTYFAQMLALFALSECPIDEDVV